MGRKLITIADLYLLLVIALIRTTSWIPSRACKGIIVRSIASVAYHLARKKRQQSLNRLASAFAGQLSKRRQRHIVRRAFHAFWQEAFALLPCKGERMALRHAELCGIEHVHRALAHGCGVILWESQYFGARYAAKRILQAQGFAISQVHHLRHLGGFANYGSATSWVRQRFIKPFFEKHEKQCVAEIFHLPSSDSLAFTRRLRHRLQQNAILCITSDGKAGHRLIPCPFLGHTESFATGMVTLAKLSGAPILPLFCLQGRNSRLIIEPPIYVETNAERAQTPGHSMMHYVRLLEAYIRRYPEQYRGWHCLGMQ